MVWVQLICNYPFLSLIIIFSDPHKSSWFLCGPRYMYLCMKSTHQYPINLKCSVQMHEITIPSFWALSLIGTWVCLFYLLKYSLSLSLSSPLFLSLLGWLHITASTNKNAVTSPPFSLRNNPIQTNLVQTCG